MSAPLLKRRPEAVSALGPMSLEDFQARMSRMQTEYQNRLSTLQAVPEPDSVAIETVAREMQSKLAELMKTFQSQIEGGSPAQVIQLFDQRPEKKPPKDPSRKIYDNSHCTLDLELAVYEGDRDSLTTLLSDPQFVFAADEVLKENLVIQHQREALKRAFHLPRAVAPRLHAAGDRCRTALGLRPSLEFQLLADPWPGITTYMPDEDRIHVILNAGLLERFNENELTFVIGHQLGHILFDHHRLPINMLLERGGPMLFPVHALRIYAWKRHAEITADRIGLICCRDLESATRALLQLSTGTRAEALDFDINAYCDAIAAGEHPEVDSGEVDPEDWHGTMPFNPARLRALSIFAKSALWRSFQQVEKQATEIQAQIDLASNTQNMIAAGGSGKSLMEDAIRELMSCFEPSHLGQRGEITQVIREFIFLGAYAVMHANGVDEDVGLRAPGVQALASILDPDTMQRGLGKVEGADSDSLWTAIGEAARELKRNLPVVTRLNIIKDLAVVTFYSGGSVSRQEQDVLGDLAVTLDLRPESVDQILQSVAKGLD